MPSISPAIVNSRTSNKYFFIKIRSWNEPITQRLRMTCSEHELINWWRILSTKMLQVLFNFSYMHSYFYDEIYYKQSLNSPIFVIGPKK